MKFSCEKLLLQNAVNTTSRAVAAKSSIPALEGLLLQCGDGVLTVSGFLFFHRKSVKYVYPVFCFRKKLLSDCNFPND